MRASHLASHLRSLLQQQQLVAEAASAARAYSTQLAVRGSDALRAGPGGRSSVNGVTATIFGCSGFLARYVAQSLGRMGTQLIFPHRCDPVDVQHLRPMGDLGRVVMLPDFDIRDDDAVRYAISRSNLVLNFIGADAETWNYGFDEVHIDIPKRLAKLSKEAGVERFVHFSALGADYKAPSRRLRTKAAGEDAVRWEMGERATIIKPAPVTGTEDRVFNRYAQWIKMFPAMPLIGGGGNTLQPVWVRDVAQATINALQSFDSMGKTYHLAGPEVYSVKELVDFTFDTIREEKSSMTVPSELAKLMVAPREWLGRRTPWRPNPAFTEDAIDELAADLVLTPGPEVLTFADLDVQPHNVTSGVVVDYLRHYRAQGYDMGTTSADATAGGGSGGFMPPGGVEQRHSA